MVTIHLTSKDGRFARLSFIGPGAAAVAGLVTAGIGALGTGISASKYLKGVRETNETNLQLAREQQAWDLAQWNRENEYNSAKAQLQRWQEAGFSPNSFVGVGSPGEAAALQSPSLANQVAPNDLSGYASSFAQSIQGGIKSALDWRQMDLNQKQLNLDKERLANETTETVSKVSLNEALTKEALANVRFIEERAKFTESERYRTDAAIEKLWQDYEQSAKMFQYLVGREKVSLDREKLSYLFEKESYNSRIRQVAALAGKTEAEIKKVLAEGIYWLWQGKEGQFQYDTQDLRWTVLSTQGKQLMFNLQFDKDTRYSQLTFERWMQGIHAASEIGHLVIDGASELRQWLRPGTWLGNTSTYFNYNDKGRVTNIERSFTPYKR